MLRNSFEGGTAGTTITAGNSGGGSGDAFTSVNAPPAGGTNAFDNTSPIKGTLHGRVQTGATSGLTSWVWGNTAGLGTPSQIWFRFYFRTGAYPVSKTRFLNFTTTGDTVQNASMILGITGILSVRSGTNVDTDLGTYVVPLNQWVRIEARYQMSNATGNADARVWDNPNSSLAVTPSGQAQPTAQNFGASTVDTYKFGIIAASATRGPYDFKFIEVNDFGFPGPYITPRAGRRSALNRR